MASWNQIAFLRYRLIRSSHHLVWKAWGRHLSRVRMARPTGILVLRSAHGKRLLSLKIAFTDYVWLVFAGGTVTRLTLNKRLQVVQTEQRRQHDRANAPWNRFTAVVVLTEQVRAAGDLTLCHTATHVTTSLLASGLQIRPALQDSKGFHAKTLRGLTSTSHHSD